MAKKVYTFSAPHAFDETVLPAEFPVEARGIDVVA